MSRYRKKPLVIDAEQWFPDPSLGTFEGDRYINKRVGYDAHGVAYTVTDVSLMTINGPVRIEPGEWIIRGIQNEAYPCKEDIFALTYEPVGGVGQ